jgi:hypothetical protein
MTTRIVRHPAAIKLAREATAYGLLNFGYAVEAATKRDAVVRGGHRSFMTGPKTKAGTARIGGTLRRSYHTAAFLDGTRIGGEPTDENGNAPPEYPARSGMLVVIGSNSGYGGFVELGTVKMAARPTLVPALLGLKGEAPALIAAGARKHVEQR